MANSATYNRTKVHFSEGAAAATPDASEVVIYAKADGLMYSKDDAGAETLMSAGTALSNPMTTAEDIIKGGVAGAPDRLALGASNTALASSNSALAYVKVAEATFAPDSLNASAAPSASNDFTQGWRRGSRWIDTVADKEYVCLDESTGAAVWTETTAASGTVKLGTPIQRVAANITVNQATWAELATEVDGPGAGGFDFDFTGCQVGDIAEVSISGQWSSTAVNAYLDVATIVSGSPVNYFGAVSPPATGQGVKSWSGPSGVLTPFGGTAAYVLQAGDLDSGALKLRPYVITSAATDKLLYADATRPLHLWAKVYRA